MAADWATAVIAATATMFFQGVAGGVRLMLAKRNERRDATRKLLAALTMLEWELHDEIEDHRGSSDPRVPMPRTRVRLREFLAAIGEARAVLNGHQIDTALALHVGIEEQVRAYESEDGETHGDVADLMDVFLGAVGASKTTGTRLKAIGTRHLIPMLVEARAQAQAEREAKAPAKLGSGPASASGADSKGSGTAPPQD